MIFISNMQKLTSTSSRKVLWEASNKTYQSPSQTVKERTWGKDWCSAVRKAPWVHGSNNTSASSESSLGCNQNRWEDSATHLRSHILVTKLESKGLKLPEQVIWVLDKEKLNREGVSYWPNTHHPQIQQCMFVQTRTSSTHPQHNHQK
jgi:hypothetical protein